jgi:hypothetical protein
MHEAISVVELWLHPLHILHALCSGANRERKLPLFTTVNFFVFVHLAEVLQQEW